MTRPHPPSGNQFLLDSHGYRAVVVEVGAGLRVLEYHDRPLVEPYQQDELCPAAHGALLAPWPNRLPGGTYTFEGTRYELPLNESATASAIHGLFRWQLFRPAWLTPHGIELVASLAPTPGYPFWIEARVAYRLGADGLSVTTTLINLAERNAPVALGHHPYLSPGQSATIEDATLRFTARARWHNGVHLPPPAWAAGTTTPLAHVVADDTLVPTLEEDGWSAWLTGPDGITVELFAHAPYRFAQVFTGDTLPAPSRRRGIAVEPMTAPPGALATGEDLAVLAPGASLSATFGIRRHQSA